MVKCNGAMYTYVHNLQGDIVAILDNTGAKVVVYKYDAWGKLLDVDGSMASSLGAFNPFRYRGYVYDQETELYYLRSRYYHPIWTRFTNSDTAIYNPNDLLYADLFTYCNNAPIKATDRSRKPASFLSELSVDCSCIFLLKGELPKKPPKATASSFCQKIKEGLCPKAKPVLHGIIPVFRTSRIPSTAMNKSRCCCFLQRINSSKGSVRSLLKIPVNNSGSGSSPFSLNRIASLRILFHSTVTLYMA